MAATELLFRDDAYLRHCGATVIAVDERGIQLDRTVFYAQGGGQPGDTGRLVAPDGTVVHIANAIKGDGPDSVIHVPAPGSPPLAIGTHVTVEIDWERRHRLMRMHTSLHLLSALLPYPVTGGQVSDGKGRLDFDMADTPPDKDVLTERLNALVAADHKVSARWISDDQLAATPDLVKTMAVKPPSGAGRVRLVEIAGIERPLDLQACGGTHVGQTGEIGRLVVRKIESKGRQNRRVILEFAG